MQCPSPPSRHTPLRESGAVRPVANLITGQAHRGSRERCDPWRI
ncbi:MULTISPECIES: hypothetical protein [Moorena]|nr:MULTISPECIES: hypothetical protein [Moorena]